MAISFIGVAAAAGSSVALPAFNEGDIGIVFAWRDPGPGTASAPSLPAGWTNIVNNGTVSLPARIGYRVLQGGDTTTSTWTNATDIQVTVLRGQHSTTPIGGQTGEASDGGSQMAYAEVSPFSSSDGTSWIIGGGCHRTATNVNTRTVTGMTLRSGSIGSMSLHSAENVSSFANVNFNETVSEGQWRTRTIEVLAESVQTISPPSIASEEAFGTAVVALATISPIGIPSQEAFGAVIVAGPVTATSVASGEQFGNATVTLGSPPPGFVPTLEQPLTFTITPPPTTTFEVTSG